jgi:hypothetical protein
MLRVKQGVINEEEVCAILQQGANWHVHFNSGFSVVLDPVDGQKLADDLAPAPAGKKS